MKDINSSFMNTNCVQTYFCIHTSQSALPKGLIFWNHNPEVEGSSSGAHFTKHLKPRLFLSSIQTVWNL